MTYFERKVEEGRRIYNRWFYRFDRWYDDNILKIAFFVMIVFAILAGFWLSKIVDFVVFMVKGA